MARHSVCAEWRVVDTRHGRSVAGATESVSALSDVPPPIPKLGQGRRAGTNSSSASRGTSRPRGRLKLDEAYVDATFASAKKGALAVGPTRRGKGTKILAVADVRSLPLAVSVQSASPHESQLVEEVLGHSFLDTLPQRLIGDKAYDSDSFGQLFGAGVWHRDDCPAPSRPPPDYARWSPTSALSETLAGGTALCLAAPLSPSGHPLGVLH
jgi:Transposase DDE domain